MEHAELNELILNSIATSIYLIDINDYTIIAANKASGFQDKVGKAKCYELTHHRDSPCDSPEHPCPLAMVKSTKLPATVEHIHYDSDGNKKDIQVNGYPVFDDDGEVTAIVEIGIDITNCVNLEDALKQSEIKYRALYESSNDAIMTLHPPEWKFTSGNPATIKMFNTKDENEFVSLGPWELSPEFQPDGMLSGDKAKMMIEKAMAEGSNYFEWTHKRYNGDSFPATVLLTRINISGDEYLQATVRDISVRKQAEQALRESEASLHEAQEIAKMGSWDFDFINQSTKWSKNCYILYGLKPFEMEPSFEYFKSRVHPDDLHIIDEEFEKLLKEKKPTSIELRILFPDGKFKWLLNNLVPIFQNNNLIGLKGINIDISDRKQGESYQKLTSEILGILNQDILMKDAIDLILREIKKETGFDAVGIRLEKDGDYPYYVQSGFTDGFLKTENTLLEHTKSGDVCRDKDGNVSLECTCGLVISGKADLNLPFFTKIGSFWTNYSEPLLDLTAEEDPRNNPRNRCIHAGFMSVAIIPIRIGNDIIGTLQLNDKKRDCFTEDLIHYFEGLSNSIGVALMRKRDEDAIKESEEKFRTISDSAKDAIIMLDSKGIISFWNKASETIFGFKNEEIIGKNFHDLFVPEKFMEAHRTAFKSFQQTGTGAAIGQTLELSAHRKGGQEFPVELSLSSIKLNGTWHAVGIVRDITDRKKAEEELKNITGTKDKFYSIIAHDLRGPMGTLMKLAALLSDEFDTFDIEDRNLFLKEIKDSSQNVFNLLENLLTWSRSQKGIIEFNPEELNLHNVVGHVLKTQRLVAGTKKILITSEIPEDIMIIADENMLKTIIRNFIGNSIKFTPEKGNIIVTQKTIDGFVQISITDNGIGMDEETRNKLFRIEQHQSSDGTAGEKGTGLGLILCKEFIEKHGGNVFVESEIGKGSTFSFTIPDKKLNEPI
ncbi:PAS domain S-box protein [Bacteroidota bacterium]